jgi:hypothetical protein
MRSRDQIAQFINVNDWRVAGTVQYLQLLELQQIEQELNMIAANSHVSYLETNPILSAFEGIVKRYEKQFTLDESFRSFKQPPKGADNADGE